MLIKWLVGGVLGAWMMERGCKRGEVVGFVVVIDCHIKDLLHVDGGIVDYRCRFSALASSRTPVSRIY
jgi:hypothetical protein